MPTTSTPTNRTAASARRFAVVLLASGYQVIATSRLIASKCAADDAREFLPYRNYTINAVRSAAGNRLTRWVKTEPITVLVKESAPYGGKERRYTCDTSITVTVDAADAFSAGEVALRLVCDPARLGDQLSAYHTTMFWEKLLPAAREPFEQMAEVLRRRGFDAVVCVGDGAGQRSLSIEVTEDGERVGTVTLVKCISAGAETAQRPILSAGLHFAGEYDIEASSTPAAEPDLWFNDNQVTPSDIACLDIDAFDELFDVVLDQREEARAAAAPTAHA